MDFGKDVKLNSDENVHIIPLGFEIDRAVRPFEVFKANRAYILTSIRDNNLPSEMNKKQKHFTDLVKAKLEKKGIKVQLNDTINIFDFFEVSKEVSKLIILEKNKGNDVFVNMCASGKLTSLGASLAALTHNAKAYYFSADRYSSSPEEEAEHGLSIIENLNYMFLPYVQIELPESLGKLVLFILCKKGESMGSDDILNALIENKKEPFKKISMENGPKRRIQQKNLVYLDKFVIGKLKKKGYITTEKQGRFNIISITESGKYVAHLEGFIE